MGQTETYLYALYKTLRNCRKYDFKSEDYKWVLGVEIVYKLQSGDTFRKTILDEMPTLFGIQVEIDYANPKNIRLFEDITYKIGLSYEL